MSAIWKILVTILLSIQALHASLVFDNSTIDQKEWTSVAYKFMGQKPPFSIFFQLRGRIGDSITTIGNCSLINSKVAIESPIRSPRSYLYIVIPSFQYSLLKYISRGLLCVPNRSMVAMVLTTLTS
jgi:hypothetical protein